MSATSAVDPIIDRAFTHHQEGELNEAEALYCKALEKDADNFQAHQLLGTLKLRGGNIDEALRHLSRALAILEGRGEMTARHALLYNNLGTALRLSGRNAEAAAYFKQGLKLDPSLIELHISLGGSLMEQGDFINATTCFESALNLDPNLPGCLCDLGTAYARAGRLEDAVELYRRALSIVPSHWPARINLAQLLRRTEKYDEAIILLTKLLEEQPGDLPVLKQLGMAHVAAGNLESALGYFRRVLAKKDDDAEALQYVANIQQAVGDNEAASKNYRRSLQLKPLITISATKSPPDFRALLLFAPGAGNTPLDCLADRAEYENNILNFFPDISYDIEMLRNCSDVVVNLIADVDQGHAMLVPAVDLVDRLGKPTVNHPRKILLTDRASIARILKSTPNCCVPETLRYKGSDLRATNFDMSQTPFSFPFLVRLTGTHGGQNFEKIDDNTGLMTFVAQHPDADFYVTDYVDYRSSDGYFRKYRYIFVNDEILPYHLAIDDKWKIHHVTTDMANQVWMQNEEKSFLENPHATFGPHQYEALRAIRHSVGLEYFGIDCGLDRSGRVVVFEVNACMLVHQHNEQFPYKIEPVNRIKAAFDLMIKRMALNK